VKIEKNEKPLLDLSTDHVNEVNSRSDSQVVITGNDNSLSTDDVASETFLHVRYCLSRALEGISLDNMSQVFAVVSDPTDRLISLDQSNKSSLRDELIAILHHQVSWYHCSGRTGEMLLLQNLLQKLDQIPLNKFSN